MLRIVQNRSADSAKSYYSHAEYYGEGQELAGKWGGKLAGKLGLKAGDSIDQKDFDALCDNLHPLTGEPLTMRTNENRTVGYDFNFHAPKGVSLAYAFGDSRIADVFDRAVSETMLDIEAEAKTRVRKNGKQEDRTTGNLLWGQFLHTTARPIDGEPDPHLHAHCFTFNCTADAIENRTKAAQFRELKRDARFFEARFHARLAKSIREELGYDIERRGSSWDIALPEDLKRRFSRRTEQIEEIAEEQKLSTEEKAELAAKTRQTKAKELSFAELQSRWDARLTPNEQQIMDELFNATTDGDGAIIGEGPRNTSEAVSQAISHSFERDAVVPERHLLAEAMRLGVGHIDVDEVKPEAEQQRVITREIDGRRVSTTPDVLADEQAVLEFARRGKGKATPLNPDWQIQQDWMSEEQKAAIHELVTSRSKVQLLLGGAGTGKTTLMTEAVNAIEAGGHQVFTFAPSAEASRGVLRDEGFSSATTVAELLVNEKLQNSIDGQVIWIDEAGLLGSRQLKAVFDLAEQKHARVILSGDWKRQHGSVDRGGVLGLLDRYAGVTPIQIKTIRRQQGKYKDAIHNIAEGNVLGGFDQLDQLGWVHEIDDDHRDEQLASDYADLSGKKRSVLVVSPTHREAEHLTKAIRTKLRSLGRITGEDHQVLSLKPLHMTEARRSDPAFYQPGDVIVFQQNAREFKKGTRITVTGELPREITDQAKRFAVYRPQTIDLAAGDKIRLTAGGKTKDGKHRLNNGAIFEVASIDESGDIHLTNGWTLEKDFGHLTNGFVTTSHASQGKTVDHVLIAESAESFAAASREQLYVSASRGRKSCRVYTDNKEELRTVIEGSSGKVAAHEVFWPGKEQQQRHEKQRKHAAPTLTSTQAPLTPEVAYER